MITCFFFCEAYLEFASLGDDIDDDNDEDDDGDYDHGSGEHDDDTMMTMTMIDLRCDVIENVILNCKLTLA